MSTLATVDKAQKGFVNRADFVGLCTSNNIDEERAVKIFQLIDEEDRDGRISYTQMLRVVR